MEQNEVNELFKEQIKNYQNIVDLLIDRDKEREIAYNKTIKNIAKWLICCLSIIMIIFTLSYFFSSYYFVDSNNSIKVNENNIDNNS